MSEIINKLIPGEVEFLEKVDAAWRKIPDNDQDLYTDALSWAKQVENICEALEKPFKNKDTQIVNLSNMKLILETETFMKYMRFRQLARELRTFGETGEMI